MCNNIVIIFEAMFDFNPSLSWYFFAYRSTLCQKDNIAALNDFRVDFSSLTIYIKYWKALIFL